MHGAWTEASPPRPHGRRAAPASVLRGPGRARGRPAAASPFRETERTRSSVHARGWNPVLRHDLPPLPFEFSTARHRGRRGRSSVLSPPSAAGVDEPVGIDSASCSRSRRSSSSALSSSSASSLPFGHERGAGLGPVLRQTGSAGGGSDPLERVGDPVAGSEVRLLRGLPAEGGVRELRVVLGDEALDEALDEAAHPRRRVEAVEEASPVLERTPPRLDHRAAERPPRHHDDVGRGCGCIRP